MNIKIDIDYIMTLSKFSLIYCLELSFGLFFGLPVKKLLNWIDSYIFGFHCMHFDACFEQEVRDFSSNSG